MDTLVISSFIIFIYKGTTWRMIIALSMFHLTNFVVGVSNLVHLLIIFRECLEWHLLKAIYGRMQDIHQYPLTLVKDLISSFQE